MNVNAPFHVSIPSRSKDVLTAHCPEVLSRAYILVKASPGFTASIFNMKLQQGSVKDIHGIDDESFSLGLDCVSLSVHDNRYLRTLTRNSILAT
jgi:hypothetical protein